MRRSDAAKESAEEVRRNGWANNKTARDDISSRKMKRETEDIFDGKNKREETTGRQDGWS